MTRIRYPSCTFSFTFDGAEVAGVEGVAAEAGEKLRRGVVLEEAAGGGGAVEGESGGPVNGCEEAGVGPGLDPAEVLDAGFRCEVGLEPEKRGSGAEMSRQMRPCRLAAARRRWEEEGSVERRSRRRGRRSPADGGDEWR
ncbi:hypothetical protein SLA2020_420300 [Shorea laevis]